MPKFICDAMLGRLAKWLRLFGYDTAYFPCIADSRLLSLAREEGRVLLTRDTGLMARRAIARRAIAALFIRDDDWRSQLRQVSLEIGLEADRPPRCPICNRAMLPVDRGAVKDKVPVYVWRTQKEFRRCPDCSRIFWPATHWRKIEKTKRLTAKKV